MTIDTRSLAIYQRLSGGGWRAEGRRRERWVMYMEYFYQILKVEILKDEINKCRENLFLLEDISFLISHFSFLVPVLPPYARARKGQEKIAGLAPVPFATHSSHNGIFESDRSQP